MKRIFTLAASLAFLFCSGQVGNLDNSFGATGRVVSSFSPSYDAVQSIAIQPDGKVVAVGEKSGGGFVIARYNTDGSPDSGFDGDGNLITAVGTGFSKATAVAIQHDGKIVVAGFAQNGGSNYDFAVIRLNADGSPDVAFGSGGKVLTDMAGNNDQAYDLAIQPDGKIVVVGIAGPSSGVDFGVVRYNANGTLDLTFDGDGKATPLMVAGYYHHKPSSVALQANGKIVVAGYSDGQNSFGYADKYFTVVRYNSDGSFDATFDGDGMVFTDPSPWGDQLESVAIQADGKIVAAGWWYNETASYEEYAIVRYNADGSLDASFGTGGFAFTDIGARKDRAFELAIQDDGKIVAGGFSEWQDDNYQTHWDFSMARYNTDGSADLSFDGDGKVQTVTTNSWELAYALSLSANRIYLAGEIDQNFGIIAYQNNAGPLITLPATLLNFSAAVQSRNVALTWKTAQEIDLAFFDIERSSDGRNFQKLGTVGAAGYSVAGGNYAFSDNNSLADINFYRLRIRSFGGQFSFSRNIIVKLKAPLVLQVFPNPAKDNIYLQIPGSTSKTKVQIVDVSGRLVKEQALTGTATMQYLSIDIGALEKGNYLVRVLDNDQVKSAKFVKQ